MQLQRMTKKAFNSRCIRTYHYTTSVHEYYKSGPVLLLLTALSTNYREYVFMNANLNQKTTVDLQYFILSRLTFPLTLGKKFKNAFIKKEEDKEDRESILHHFSV